MDASQSDREGEFLRRVVRPRLTNMTPEAARAILALRIDDRDQERMSDLLKSSDEGTLSAEDQSELESYLTMGRFLDLMRAKALGSLKKVGIEVTAHANE